MPRVKCQLIKLPNLLFRTVVTSGTNELLPIAACKKCTLYFPIMGPTARFFASENSAHWVTNQNGRLPSRLTHRLYSIKHRSAHNTKNFSQTLPTVEFSPSSFPESKKEAAQKINLVAERAVKDSGDAIGCRRSASPGTASWLYRSLGSAARWVPTLWVQELFLWLCLADWLFHFLFALLILFCIPLWAENNPDRTRPSYRTPYLIFSFWIIHKESLSLPFLGGCHASRFPTHSVFLLKQELWIPIHLLTQQGRVPGVSVYSEASAFGLSLSLSSQ